MNECHLDWLSARADTEVDDLIDRVAPPDFERVGELLRYLGRTPEVAAFMAQPVELPDWVEHDKLRRAEDFFRVWGLQLCVGLFFAGLPRSYTSPWSALALRRAAGFRTDARTRLSTTGKFMIEVMSLDEEGVPLGPGSRGQQQVRTVRLFHGAVRHWLEAHPDRWSPGRDPIPLNQEEMLAGVLLFSAGALEALDRMGVRYTQEEADAYVHTWCVAGALMGVGRLPGSPIEFPLSAAEARELGLRIQQRHLAESEAGRELTHGLIRLAEQSCPPTMRWLPRTLLRQLSGDEVADVLGVARGPVVGRHLVASMGRAGRGFSRLVRLPVGDVVSGWIGRRVIDAYLEGSDGADAALVATMEQWRSTADRRRATRSAGRPAPGPGPTRVTPLVGS